MRIEWTDAVRRERQTRGQRCPVVTGRTYGDLLNELARVYGSAFGIEFRVAGGGATVATRNDSTIGTVKMDDGEEKHDEFSENIDGIDAEDATVEIEITPIQMMASN